ncbi:MAG: hypothetical protein ABS54_11755 [Hyphomicrobium sp. SCN 65-11]|nr:MAG: hypothetical protein ABS54_11755 [Hyphomicrobium sp. SCN 65-11]
MDKTRIHIFGKGLRRSFCPPDDLPYPMRKALEALASSEAAEVREVRLDLPQSESPQLELRRRATDQRGAE